MAPFAFFELSAGSIALLLILGAVLFGKELPSVGGWLGKTLKSVRDGLSGVENEVTSAAPPTPSALEAPRPPQRVGAMTPRFDETPQPPPPSA